MRADPADSRVGAVERLAAQEPEGQGNDAGYPNADTGGKPLAGAHNR
jgi:hypothetical protein